MKISSDLYVREYLRDCKTDVYKLIFDIVYVRDYCSL